MMDYYVYFTEDEMKCRHCGECRMDKKFMSLLDMLRGLYGKPIRISSGYRCKDHPIEAKKEKGGAHTTGRAADLLVSGKDAHAILKLAMDLGFKGVGISQKGDHDSRFIHLDTCTTQHGLHRPTIWSY